MTLSAMRRHVTAVTPHLWERLQALSSNIVERPSFTAFVTVIIILNAITLGLETSETAVSIAGSLLATFDRVALAIFTVELSLKLIAFGPRFFRDGWNLFDSIVVAIAWVPSGGAISVLRALRVLRVLRILSIVPQLRAVVSALLAAVPGMGAIVAVLLLVFYVAAVIATKFFAAAFPDWFGDVGASMYTLFQIMTLESWSMGIVRPVMEVHPWAWVFFVPFIVVTSFAVLNLFIALIVKSLQAVHDDEIRGHVNQAEAVAHEERERLLDKLEILTQEVQTMQGQLQRLEDGKSGQASGPKT